MSLGASPQLSPQGKGARSNEHNDYCRQAMRAGYLIFFVLYYSMLFSNLSLVPGQLVKWIVLR